MKIKVIALALLVPVLLLALIFGYVIYKGPRMTSQHHIRDFQMSLANQPADTVAVHAPPPLPAAAPAAAARNPLPASADNLARARVYYQYYCVFCHGVGGTGDGAVGQSYFPRPTDLLGAKVSAASDGALLRAMLTGVGHEPVLERIVPPEHRWYLVLHLRSLTASRPPG